MKYQSFTQSSCRDIGLEKIWVCDKNSVPLGRKCITKNVGFLLERSYIRNIRARNLKISDGSSLNFLKPTYKTQFMTQLINQLVSRDRQLLAIWLDLGPKKIKPMLSLILIKSLESGISNHNNTQNSTLKPVL